MTRSRVAIVVALLTVLAAVGWAARPHAETPVERVDRLTSELRCVVCQGLSVKDSPAESARQMRDIVVQRVAEGKSDEEIRDEFRNSYGDWVMLAPPVASWSGLVWLAPFVALVAGILVAVRWMRPRAVALPEPPPAEVAALRERVAREEAADAPMTETT